MEWVVEPSQQRARRYKKKSNIRKANLFVIAITFSILWIITTFLVTTTTTTMVVVAVVIVGVVGDIVIMAVIVIVFVVVGGAVILKKAGFVHGEVCGITCKE